MPGLIDWWEGADWGRLSSPLKSRDLGWLDNLKPSLILTAVPNGSGNVVREPFLAKESAVSGDL
jgi:hypothetical protein